MATKPTATETSSTPEFSKFFDKMKFPAIPDGAALMTAHQRNYEALSAANRVALEGAQAVARRHMEIMQQAMTEMNATLKTIASTEGAQERAAKQTEMMKEAYQRAIAHMREIGDLIQTSSAEAMDLLNKRFADAMDEAKALIEKPAAK
jgi:phasin family protein